MAPLKKPRRTRPGSKGRSRPKTSLLVELLECRDLPSGLLPLGLLPPDSRTPAIHWDHIVLSEGGTGGPLQTAGATGTTPAQIRQAYGLNQIGFNNGTVPADGSGTTIAIVDAYDDPNITSDLHQFDQQFGLPDPPTFTIVNQDGGSTLPPTPPTGLSGWATEIALDVEWSHAIAPMANILLVEANDQNQDASGAPTSLLAAVAYAAKQPGVVAVSMSWGYPEYPTETSSDSVFQTPSGHPGVTFIAASGDNGAPPGYPAASPNVLAVGGTTLNLDASGNIIGQESGWSGSGGGLSSIEPQPSYQSGLVIHNGTAIISANGKRANPDVAYNSDPNTGFPVYDTFTNPVSTPWEEVGGTSDGAPQWAALIAIADQGRALLGLAALDGPGQTLPRLYALPATDFHDITTGTSTGSPNYTAGPGYDLVTGRGTPVANQIVAALLDSHFAVTAPLAATAGSAFTVTLTALDGSNHALTGYTGSVQFTSSDSQAVLPAAATMTNGVGIFTVTLKTAGNQSLTAADALANSMSGSTTITVSPVATAQLGVSPPPGATVGVPFTFTVTAQDRYHNGPTLYNGTVHFTSSDSAATLPADSSLTGGVGVFSATLQTLGLQTLTATDVVTSSITGASQPISVSNAATHFLVTATANATAGNPVTLTVTASDASNVIATGYTGTVHFTSSDSQAVLPANALLTDGVAVFSATLKTAGSQTLRATDTTASTITGTSNTITVSPLAATHIVVTVPNNVGGDVPFSFTVTAEDQFNNAATSFSGAVHFSSSDPRALLPGLGMLTSGTGAFTATFKTTGNQTLTAAIAGSSVNFAQAPGSPITVGSKPAAVVSGDFNSALGSTTGSLDLAVANSSDNTVSILLGDGTGTFQAGGTYLVGSDPFALAVGDLTHDGNLDLVVANKNSNNVSVLLGNGNGSFQAAANYAVAGPGILPEAVAVGDLNGDGKPDLAVTCYNSSYYGAQSFVAILLGNGDGTFGPAKDYPVGSAPLGLAEGDFNHDGKLDLAVANFGDNTVSVLLGNGDGTFKPATNYPVGYGPVRVAVGDLNGDGYPDLAVTNYLDGTVSVLLANANGTFKPPVNYTVDPQPYAVAVADINGDGKPDLVTTSLYTYDANVMLGNGDGTFSAGQSIPSGGYFPISLAIGDFTGDGAPGLAVANYNSNSVTILLNQEMTGSATVQVGTAAASHYAVTAASGAIVGAALSFTVTALDQFNNTATACTGTVGFTSSDPAAILPLNGPLTGGIGTFSATLLTLGSQKLTATDALTGSITGVSNAITVSYPASHFLVSALTNATAGSAFALTVTALDQFNNTVSAYNGTIHFTSSDSQAVLAADAPLTNGVGTFTVTLDTLGNQILTATDTATSSLTGTSGTILVSPGMATHFAVSAAPTSIAAGNAVTFTVTALDQFNDTATGYTGTVTFTSTDTNPSTSLPGPTTLSAGMGSFSATLTTAGSQTLAAADSVATSITGHSNTIIVRPLAATHLGVKAPATVTAGTAFGFTVTAQDPFNNTAPTYTGTVAFTLGASASGATLPANSTLANGVGAFTTTLTASGNQTLLAADTNTSSIAGASGTIAVKAAAAMHFTVLAGPGNITAGNPVTLTMTALDQFNNTATGYTGIVTFTSSDTGPSTALPGTSPLIGGVGIFSATLTTAGNQTLTATDKNTSGITGTISATSGTMVVSAASVKHFAVNAPGLTTAGSALTFTVTAQDQFNNTAPSYNGTVTISTSDAGPSTALPLQSPLDSGVGTFSATLTTSGSQTLTATDQNTSGTTGTINGTSGPIAVSAATATHFAVRAPANGLANIGFSFTVSAQDRFNNTATSYNGTVSFSSNDTAATLPQDTPLANGAGTFTATLTTLGNQTLTATDNVTSSLTGTSKTILVIPTPASHFVVSAAPSSITASASVTLTVTAEDQFDRTVTGYAGTVTFTSSDTGASTVLPASSPLTGGLGTFTATLTTTGGQTLTAIDQNTSGITGTISGASNTITVSAANASRLLVTAPAAVTASSSFSVTVTALDPFNNAATGYTGTVTLSANGDSAPTFVPASATLTNGVGTFTATLYSPTPSRTLTATGTGLGAFNTTVSVTAASIQLTVTAPPIVVEGSTFGVTVTATDGSGNIDTQYNKVVTIHDSVSNADFVGFVAGGTGAINVRLLRPGTQTLTASDGSISAISNTITVTHATHFALGAASPQTAGSAFSFTVTATDDYGNTDTLYSGTVAFSSSDSAANFVPASGVLPGGTGVFTATLFKAGGQTLTATDGILGGTSGTIEVAAKPATHFAVSAPATATAGSALSITVTGQDQYGNTATDYAGTVAFTSTDTAASLPADSTLTSGVGTFTVTLKTAGRQALRATDTVRSTIAGHASAISVSPAAAADFVVSAPMGATAGSAFTFTVTAQDQFDNTATDYSGTVAFANSDSAGTLPRSSTLAAGVGLFIATLATAGNQTLAASDASASNIAGTSRAITVSPGAAAHFALSAPSTATAGSAFRFTVTAQDAFNNTATGYSGTIALTSSDTAAAAPLGGALVSGVGAFSATLITAGNQTLTVTDSAASSITGNGGPIAVSAAAAAHFALAAPSTATAGSAFRFTVTAQDAFNNTASAYSGTVALTSSDTAANLPAGSTLTAGVGIFSATVVTAGNQTLIATDIHSGTVTGTSNTVSVSAAPATHFMVAAPATASAEIAFSATVQALDQYNNAATSYSGTVTFSSTDSAATLPANGALTSGLGAFSVILASLGSQTITATGTAANTITGTSSAITVNRPPATHFAVSATAGSVTAGKAIGFTVTALDQFNHTAVDYTGTVAFSSSDNAAILAANNTLTSGVGTFSMTLVTAGSQTLTATDAGASSIIGSAAVNVNAAAAAQFVVTAPAFAIADRAFSFTVLAQDQYGNTATAYTGTVGFSSSDTDPGALLPAASTLHSGVGVFSATLATVGIQSLSAQDTNAPTITGSTTLTVPVTVYIPNLNTPRSTTTVDTTVTVPIMVNALEDPAGSLGQSGLSSGTFVLFYNPSVFSVSSTDVQLGTLGTPTTPGDGYSAGAPNGWYATVLASSPGALTVTVNPAGGAPQLTGTGGGTLVTVNFHVLANAPLGSSVIDLAADTAGPNSQPITSINDAVDNFDAQAPYNLIPAPQDNTVLSPSYGYRGTDPVDGIVTVTATGPATHFVVSAPSNTTAGNPFVIRVTAEDRFNNTAAAYGGTVHFTSGDSQAGLPADGTLTSGIGFFAAVLKTAGSQTITATDTASGSITGITSAVAVRAAAANHFVVTAVLPSYTGIGTGPTSFATTGIPVSFTVMAQDPFGNIAPTYAGTVHFTSGDTAAGVVLPPNSTLTNGMGTFSASLRTPGTQTLTATDTVQNSGSTAIIGASNPFAVRGLVVTSFTTTPTGFTVTFNKPFQPNTVNLYTTGTLPDDAILAATGAQVSVRGSVLFNSATNPTSITFIKTNTVSSLGTFNPGSGLLAAGNYTVTLRSYSATSSGFEDALSSPLDGNNSGSPGANFVFTFSVSAPPVAVGIPDFARGPSNTDALFLPTTIGNGNTFNLIYTNPNTAPTTGTATITFSTTAATLLNNIQNALNALPQVGLSGSIPNSAVVVINDTPAGGANIQVTFQGTLAQATNQLLASTTPGVSISLATINAANNIPGNGIPIALSSGLNVTSGTFTLQYNPTLLNITGAVSKIAGATFTLNTTINNATSATAVLSLSSPSRIGSAATAITIGSLLATVPLSATASYGAKQLLHFSSEQLNGTAGPIAVTNQDGVQVVAYLGDVTGTGGPFSLQDATAISAVAGGIANTVAQTIPGFATFPNLDPAIIGDVSLAGTVSFADATLMNQQLVSAQAKIPYAPIGLSVPPVVPDLVLSVRNLAPGGSPSANYPADAPPADALDIAHRTSHIAHSTAPLDQVFAELARTTAVSLLPTAYAIGPPSAALTSSTADLLAPTADLLVPEGGPSAPNLDEFSALEAAFAGEPRPQARWGKKPSAGRAGG